MPVELRPLAETDLPALFEQQRDPVAMRMAAFVPPERATWPAFEDHWRRVLDEPAVTARAILLDGRLVGVVASFLQDGKPQVTYWLDRAHWGRGLATEALRRFLRELPQRPLFASAAADNAGSLRVLEQCGFRRVGSARAFAAARGHDVDEVLLELR
ncbi:MAG: GNAT family N-acetyltransferase [Halobacteriales archaeon]|nr:GNAT family N-acetyltransferase [Halobacteriales archaeon]